MVISPLTLAQTFGDSVIQRKFLSEKENLLKHNYFLHCTIWECWMGGDWSANAFFEGNSKFQFRSNSLGYTTPLQRSCTSSYQNISVFLSKWKNLQQTLSGTLFQVSLFPSSKITFNLHWLSATWLANSNGSQCGFQCCCPIKLHLTWEKHNNRLAYTNSLFHKYVFVSGRMMSKISK